MANSRLSRVNTGHSEDLRLMFVGDISLGEHFFSFGHGPRSMLEWGKNPLEDCKSLFAQAHLVIGNLEGPVSDVGYNQNSALSRVFRGNSRSAEALIEAGINVVSIANNHSMQHGLACFWDSIRNLELAGVTVIGKNRTLEKWTILTVHGRQIGLIAASDIEDINYIPHQSYRKLDMDEVLSDIEALKCKCDVVVLALHWGTENHISPDASLIDRGNRLLSAGADIVVSHHSHIFYPLSVKKGGLIAYSLGNFVFDLPWSSQLRHTAVLDVTVTPANKIRSVSLWPVYISRQGNPKLIGEKVKISLSEGSDLPLFFDLFRFQSLDSLRLIRKLIYFILMLPFGATRLKLDFILWKIRCKLHL